MTGWEDERALLRDRIMSLRGALEVVCIQSHQPELVRVAYDALANDGMAAVHGMALREATAAALAELLKSAAESESDPDT